MDFQQFKDWALLALIGGLFTLVSALAAIIWRSLGNMTKSVQELNATMVQMLERSEWHAKVIQSHDDKLENHETRISHLEVKKNSRPKTEPLRS